MLNAKISVLVSGGGTGLQSLLDAQAEGTIRSGHIVQVISSRGDAYALERAKRAGVRADVVEYRNFQSSDGHGGRDAFERQILRILDEEKPDVIVLAGFIYILSAGFVKHYEGRIINVHPSLIPSFCGKGFYGLKVHEAVLKAGVKVTGATVHIVTATADDGPILRQKAVEVLPDDTTESLQRRVMEQAEWVILPQAVEALCEGLEERVLDLGIHGNRYPGRGIILGTTPDGRPALAYFIMGRSPSSRARVFERSGDDVVIKLLNAARGLSDMSLILYSPIRVLGDCVIVTNGDQTETIYETMFDGGTFEDALRAREFEPDPPHYTPRISGVMFSEGGYRLSILKADADRNCERQFFEYAPLRGTGHLIHTYETDGNPLPSFRGEPREVEIPDDIDTFADGLWSALDAENKVSLYVRFMDTDGTFEDRLFNKYGK